MKKNRGKKTKKGKYRPPEIEKIDLDKLPKDWSLEASLSSPGSPEP